MPETNDTGDQPTIALSPSEGTTTVPSSDAGTPTPDATPPQPSSGTPDPEPKKDDGPASMSEAIEQALNGSTDPNPPAKAEAPKEGETPEGDAAPAKADAKSEKGDEDGNQAQPGEADDDLSDANLSADPSEEELNSYKPGVRKRMKQLLADRYAAQQEVETLRPDANTYRDLRTFMSRNQLNDQDVADLLKAGADLRSGTAEGMQRFLSRVQPLVQLALEATGQAVPADLQGRVDSGEVTEDVALQLAKARREAELNAARAAQNQQQAVQHQNAATQQQILGAVQNWNAQKQASDPDFGKKLALMRRVSQAIVQEKGYPRTAAEAVQYADAAYAEVNQILAASAPPKAPTRPAPTSQTAPNRSAVTTAPASLDDVIEQGLRQ